MDYWNHIQDILNMDAYKYLYGFPFLKGPSMNINYSNSILLIQYVPNGMTTEMMVNMCSRYGPIIFCSVGKQMTCCGVKSFGGVIYKNRRDALVAYNHLNKAHYYNTTLRVVEVSVHSSYLHQSLAITMMAVYYHYRYLSSISFHDIPLPHLYMMVLKFEHFVYQSMVETD